MLNVELIKTLIKNKGYTLETAAIKIGMSYQGFYKALKKGRLRHERKVLLAQLLHITVEELDTDPPKKNTDIPIDALQKMIDDKERIIYLQQQEINRLNEQLKEYRKNV